MSNRCDGEAWLLTVRLTQTKSRDLISFRHSFVTVFEIHHGLRALITRLPRIAEQDTHFRGVIQLRTLAERDRRIGGGLIVPKLSPAAVVSKSAGAYVI